MSGQAVPTGTAPRIAGETSRPVRRLPHPGVCELSHNSSEMKLWDAIVVGAGPAGCAAAYDIARSGREVLLLDRAEFPRQKACAGGLTLKAMQALRYSIDPVVRERISDMHIERGPGNSAVLRRRSPYCFMTVRQDLDDYCLRQTLAAGANLQRIRALTGIREDSAGITVLTDSGELQT